MSNDKIRGWSLWLLVWLTALCPRLGEEYRVLRVHQRAGGELRGHLLQPPRPGTLPGALPSQHEGEVGGQYSTVQYSTAVTCM